LFNINTRTWEALAIYGQMPISRWSSIITQLDGDTKDDAEGFYLFGGVTINSYCKASLFNFHLLTKETSTGSGKKSLLEQIKQNAV
jgi:hypothetical protein